MDREWWPGVRRKERESERERARARKRNKGGRENEKFPLFHSRRITGKEGKEEGKKEDRRSLIEDLDKDVDESEIDLETGEELAATTTSTSLSASRPPVKELTRKMESSLKLVDDDDDDDVEVIVDTAEEKTGFAEAKTPRNGTNYFFSGGQVARKGVVVGGAW